LDEEGNKVNSILVISPEEACYMAICIDNKYFIEKVTREYFEDVEKITSANIDTNCLIKPNEFNFDQLVKIIKYNKDTGEIFFQQDANFIPELNTKTYEIIKINAIGDYSHTEGIGTIATVAGSHIQGKYNIEDNENKYVHIVGWGEKNTPANIHTITNTGDSWYSGNLSFDGKMIVT
jgi:hypothetical protein